MIKVAKDNGIWTLTLNRPDKANALTKDMLLHLTDIVQNAQAARVLILTGAGNVFSAGADLTEARSGLATDPVWEDLSGAIADLPILTIAALNGTLAGGAFGMALACDLRICVPSARFFYPVMKLGFLPQPSDPVRLSRLIGPARTKLILMAGQNLDAGQAYDFGLVDMVANAKDFPEILKDISGSAHAADPDIAKNIKRMIWV